MEYIPIEQARTAGGLRLALTAGVPGPWSEAAKGVLRVRDVDYLPVAQQGGAENPELMAWTGHRNAPTAMYNDESARVSVVDIINLAQRLGSGPSLLPEKITDRVLMFGLLNEIAGENGLAWQARVLMFANMIQTMGEQAMVDNPMLRDYHFDPAEVSTAPGKVIAILEALSQQLASQSAAGSRYFIGDKLCALDIYWACFSQMLEALPPEVNPMPDYLRAIWGMTTPALTQEGYTLDPRLLAHRDYIFPTYLQWPLDF